MKRLRISKQTIGFLSPSTKKLRSRFGNLREGRVMDARGRCRIEFDGYNVTSGRHKMCGLVTEMVRHGEEGEVRAQWPDGSETRILVVERAIRSKYNPGSAPGARSAKRE